MRSRFLIFVIILAQFFAILPDNFILEKAYASDITTNYAPNASLEYDGNGDNFPDGWGTKIPNAELTTDNPHKDSKSLALAINADNQTGIIQSDFITVVPGVTYDYSVWARTSGINGALIGLAMYNAEGQPLQEYTTEDGFKRVKVTELENLSRSYPLAAWGTPFTAEWKQYSNTYQPNYPEIRLIKIFLYSEYNNGANGSGTIYFDDIEFSQQTAIGCAGGVGTCDDFNTSSLTENGVTLGGVNTEQATLDGRTVRNILPQVGTDPTDPNYKRKGYLQVYFPSDGIPLDANGFPTVPLVFEVRYKQSFKPFSDWDQPTNPDGTTNYWYHKQTSNSNAWQPVVYSYTDENTYLLTPWGGIGGLMSDGFGGWRTAQFNFPVNPLQKLRSFDGHFKLEISLLGEDVIPIDYVALKQVSNNTLDKIKYEERFILAQPDEFVETNPAPSQDFLWYSTSIMKQTYQNSHPILDGADKEVEKPLYADTAWGETEPLAYSIFTKQDVSLSFIASDLTNGSAIIGKDQIELRKLTYDAKYVNSSMGGFYTSKYRTLPDRIAKFTTADIKANNSQQFWVTVTVPEKIPGGTYSGKITINNCPANASSCEIPISLNVLPLKLAAPEAKSFIYGSTASWKNSSEGITQDFKSHYVIPEVMNHGYKNTLDGTTTPVYLIDDLEGYEKEIVKLQEEGLVTDTIFINQIRYMYSALRDLRLGAGSGYTPLPADPEEAIRDPKIQNMYKTFFDNTVRIAKSHGIKNVYYSWQDELGDSPDARLEAGVIYPLIKAAGGKTWQTYQIYHTNAPLKAIKDPQLDPAVSSVYYYRKCKDTDDQSLCTKTVENFDHFTDVKTFVLTEDTPKKLPDLINQYIGSFGYYTTYWTNGRLPFPSRFLNGIGATATDAKIVANYCYSDAQGDPYDDFDQTPTNADTWNYVDFLYSYPSWDGSMSPTLLFEGTREGIKDAKYIATLKNEIALNSKDPKKWAIIKEANDYLLNISANATAGVFHDSKDPKYYDDIRAKVIGYIKDLHTSPLVVVPNKKYAGKGSKVTFDVSFTNRSTSAVTDITVSVPTTADFKPVAGSATESGTVTDDKIEWKVGKIEAGQIFKAQYTAIMQ